VQVVVQIARGRSAESTKTDLLLPILQDVGIKDYNFSFGYRSQDYYRSSTDNLFVFVNIGMFGVLSGATRVQVGEICNPVQTFNIHSFENGQFEYDAKAADYGQVDCDVNILNAKEFASLQKLVLFGIADDMPFVTPEAYSAEAVQKLSATGLQQTTGSKRIKEYELAGSEKRAKTTCSGPIAKPKPKSTQPTLGMQGFFTASPTSILASGSISSSISSSSSNSISSGSHTDLHELSGMAASMRNVILFCENHLCKQPSKPLPNSSMKSKDEEKKSYMWTCGTCKRKNVVAKDESGRLNPRTALITGELTGRTKAIEKLLWTLPLKQKPPIKMFGKTVHQQRDVNFFSDHCSGYLYSGVKFKAEPLTKELRFILDLVNETFDDDFNGILVNKYHRAGDYIGAHSDNEKELGKSGVVSISFGAERKFRLRDVRSKKMVTDIQLKHRMVLHMAGAFQEDFTHEIPVQKSVHGARLSLTFRKHLK